MKRSLLIIYIFVLFCCASLVHADADGWYTEGGNYTPSTRIRLTLSNPLDVSREECPVTVSVRDLPFRNFGPRDIIVVDPALESRPEPSREELLRVGGHMPRGEVNGHYIHYQLDDLDRDGLFDELFFMTDFKPKETKTIFVYVGYNNRGLYPHGTFAAVADYSRHSAPMWESELITWKLFFPTDVDIQAKRVPMLNGYYTLTSNMSGYHFDFDRGSDIMTVSTSFGGGGICLFEHAAMPDSVSRPLYSPWRKTGPLTDTRFNFDVIASGPLRSIVHVRTMNWRSGDGAYELEQFYTAYQGKNYSTCNVRYQQFDPFNGKAEFGCGIRKIMFENESEVGDGYVISIARDMPVIDPNPESLERQRTTIDFAGIAMIVPDRYNPDYRNITSFQGNHAFALPVTDDLSYDYLITACWSEGLVANTPDKFKSYIKSLSREYNNPILLESAILETKTEGYKPIEYWGWDNVHQLR